MSPRRLPAEAAAVRRAFDDVAETLRPATRSLTDAVPGTRSPGAPLPVAVAGYIEALDRAARLMPAWRHPALEARWLACADGLREARRRAEVVAGGERDVEGFEGMLAVVSSLLDPLDPFVDAERAVRAIGRGSRTN